MSSVPGFTWARSCHFSNVMEAALARWNLARDFPDAYVEKIGISEIDDVVKIGRGRVTVIAGREGSGKSALALNMAQYVSYRGPVLYLMTEMTIDDVVNRAVAAAGHHPVAELELGPSDETLENATKTLAHLTESSDLTIVDIVGQPTNKCFIAIKTWLNKTPSARMIVLDNLFGLALGSVRGDMGLLSNELGSITTRLQAIAKDHDVALIVVHHTNRESVSRMNAKGKSDSSDLGGSDHIGRFSDHVCILKRRPERPGDFPNGIVNGDPTHDLDVPKNRFGRSRVTIGLRFIGAQMRFEGTTAATPHNAPPPVSDNEGLFREARRNLPDW